MEYYNAIGINSNSTEEEIKKAWRTLAKKFHPDKNEEPEAEKKFKEINNAYDELIEQKTEILIFEEPWHKDILEEFYITLEELYKGTTIKIVYQKEIIDTDFTNEKCEKCLGTGLSSILEIIAQKSEKCSECKGKGYNGMLKKIQSEIEINIEPGTQNDPKFVFEEKGNQLLNGSYGDLIIQGITEEHKIFKRFGNDLHVNFHVTFKESLLGFERTIIKLDGSKFKFKFKGPIQYNKKKVLKHKGFKISDKRGDMVITITFNNPICLTNEQKNVISNFF